jgi:hypothetical protein
MSSGAVAAAPLLKLLARMTIAVGGTREQRGLPMAWQIIARQYGQLVPLKSLWLPLTERGTYSPASTASWYFGQEKVFGATTATVNAAS